MFVRVREDVVYLLRGEEIELGEFLVGGMVEVDGCVMKGIEVRLELLIIDLAELGEVGINIADYLVEGKVVSG
jgi:hypothetical protein